MFIGKVDKAGPDFYNFVLKVSGVQVGPHEGTARPRKGEVQHARAMTSPTFMKVEPFRSKRIN